MIKGRACGVHFEMIAQKEADIGLNTGHGDCCT